MVINIVHFTSRGALLTPAARGWGEGSDPPSLQFEQVFIDSSSARSRLI